MLKTTGVRLERIRDSEDRPTQPSPPKREKWHREGLFVIAFLALLPAATLFGAGDVCDAWDVCQSCAPAPCGDCGCCSPVCTCADDGWADACDRWFLFPQHECGVKVHGWLDGGFIGNTSSPGSKFNGPYNAVDRSNEVMLNQTYLIAESDLPASGGGLGFRFDALYGEDFFLAESIGMEKNPDGSPRWNGEYYGLAIPQAYVAYGSKRLSLQVGHFYSVVGYEGVMAPDNFFYSKSYSYQFAGPFTHWGCQMNWSPSAAWTVNLGLHNGWDALDRVSDDVGFIGRVRYDSPDSGGWTSFAVVTGKEFSNPSGRPLIADAFTNRTRYSWLVGVPIGPRMEYVFHHWLGLQEDGAPGGGQADWYGIDQYLYYTINNCWKAGVRVEWFRDEDGTRVGLNRSRNPNDPPFPGHFSSLSVGLNWTPTANVMLRPELRADWYDGDAARQPFDDGGKDTQLMIGLDAILLF